MLNQGRNERGPACRRPSHRWSTRTTGWSRPRGLKSRYRPMRGFKGPRSAAWVCRAHRPRQTGWRGAWQKPDQVLAPVLVDISPAGVGAEPGNSRFDLLDRHLELLHGGRVGRDPVLAHLAPDRDHLRDAGKGEER